MIAIWKNPYRSDAKQILGLCIPYIFSYILELLLMPTVSIIFMGWIGQLEFNACTIARILYVLFGTSCNLGLTYACDTLLSQAYGGNKREMGTVIQQAMLIAVNAILIAWIFLCNVQYLTGFIERNKQVARLINEYLSWSIIMVPFEAFSILAQKFTINHGVTWLLLAVNIIGNIVNIIAHYLLLYIFHFGVRSPPIAFSCAYLSMALLCIVYLRLSSIAKDTWHPWTRECLQGWTMYLKLGLSGVIVIFTETVVYGGALLLSSLFGEDAVTAQGVVFYVDTFLYLISLAFGVSSSIVIGRYLGAKQYDKAQQAKSVVYNTALIIIIIMIVCGFSLLYWIPYLFHTPASALKQTRYLLAIVISLSAVDFYHVSQASILKACGKQHIDAIFLLLTFCILEWLVIGLPLSYHC
jgi:MATE family multidrug resistance protein